MCKPCLPWMAVADQPRQANEAHAAGEVQIEIRGSDAKLPTLGRHRVVVEAGRGNFQPWRLMFYCASE